jgi:hypothetical protein
LIIGDLLVIGLLLFFVYLQPQFILKNYSFPEKSVFVPDTRHVLRKSDEYEENAIQADMLINDISRNKFILFPKYSVVKKVLQSCPQNKCDSKLNREKLCSEPNLKTGENIWCLDETLKERTFQNLETIDFKIYRRIFPQQYRKVIDKMNVHGKGNRRPLELEEIPVMTGFDRLKNRLEWGNQIKSFISGTEYISKISFQEIFYKIKVSPDNHS